MARRSDHSRLKARDTTRTSDGPTSDEMVALDNDDDAEPADAPIDPFNSTRASRIAYQSVLGVLHGFATTLCIAKSLAVAEREVDLTGLHETAGLLCARALDLRPEHGRQLIPRLRSVLEDLDALHTSLVPARPGGPSAST